MCMGHRGKHMRGFLALMSTTFIFYAFNNAVTSAMPTYVMDLGGSALLASAQTSLFVLTAILLRLVFGPMSDRRGPRFVMIVGALGLTVPCAFLPLCDGLWQVVALRVCQAVGLAAFHPCVPFVVSLLSAPEKVGRHLGAMRFVSTLSLMVGPVALFPLINEAGYEVFFWALCAMGFMGLVLLVSMNDGMRTAGSGKVGAGGRCGLVGSSEGRQIVDNTDAAEIAIPTISMGMLNVLAETRTPDTNSVASSHQGLLRQRVALLAFPLACALGYGVALNFGKTLMAEVLPDLNDGLLFTFVSVGGLVGSLACGQLADRVGTRTTVAGSLGLMSAGAFVLAFARVLVPITVGSILFGAGYFGSITALTAALARSVGESGKGRALALQQSCLDLGLATGSLLAGVAVQMSGSVFYAFLMAAVLIGLCVPAWLAVGRVVS